MINLIRRLFSSQPPANLKSLISNGTIIIDVRSEAEFQTGHANGSINIPLNKLEQNLSKLKKDKPVIVCCASGMRSASAKAFLQKNGFAEVYNAGGWKNLEVMQ